MRGVGDGCVQGLAVCSVFNGWGAPEVRLCGAEVAIFCNYEPTKKKNFTIIPELFCMPL